MIPRLGREPRPGTTRRPGRDRVSGPGLVVQGARDRPADEPEAQEGDARVGGRHDA